METMLDRENPFARCDSRSRCTSKEEVVFSQRRSMAVDYRDVFGGPPTIVPLHEARHGDGNGCEAARFETPVFGNSGNMSSELMDSDENFFDDIYKFSYDSFGNTLKRRGDLLYSSAAGDGVASSRSMLFETDNEQQRRSFIPAPYSTISRQDKVAELPSIDPGTFDAKKKDMSSNFFFSSVTKIRDILETSFSSKSNVSKESSPKSGNSFRNIKKDLEDKGSRSDRWFSASDSDGSEMQNGSNSFHFSIYKWASKGVPLSTLLRSGRNSLSKDKGKIHRCSSFSGWLNESARKRIPRVSSRDSDFPSFNSDSSSSVGFVKGSDKEEFINIVDPNYLDEKPEIQRRRKDQNLKVSDDESIGDNLKSAGGSAMSSNDNGLKTCFFRNTPVISDCFDQDVISASKFMKPSSGKKKNGGKVKDFVKIYNQHPLSNPEWSVNPRKYSSMRKEMSTNVTYNEKSPPNTAAELSSHASSKVADSSIFYYSQGEAKEKNEPRRNNPESKITRAKPTPFVPGASEGVSDCDSDNCHFLVEELSHDDLTLDEAGGSLQAEEAKAVDAKVRSWCKGKEGNIRSLLSTLQYVLWPGSGWKPVPLVDIIDGNAVKKSYQKALLCIHPDKLQQKGALNSEKVIAEKVFDILQEAWSHFNTVSM